MCAKRKEQIYAVQNDTQSGLQLHSLRYPGWVLFVYMPICRHTKSIASIDDNLNAAKFVMPARIQGNLCFISYCSV